ncbi:MAG: EAL domain-containing protein [Sphingomonas sp.]
MARAPLIGPDRQGMLRRRLTASAATVAVARGGSKAPKAKALKNPSSQFDGTNLPLAGDASLKPRAADGVNWHFLCLVEIANFSQLRRQMGAERAGSLIAEVADRVSSLLPDAQISAVARSALEFTFEGRRLDDAEAVLGQLRGHFLTPVESDGERYRFDLTLAAAGSPSLHFDDVRLAEQVEEAAVSARLEQRIVVRDLSEGAPAFDRLSLMRDLGHAVENGEMFLQYQPKIHVRRQRVTSVEALIRWRHPARGLILPNDFIPAAEDSQEIGALTLWTLDQVIADYAELVSHGHELDIFINISGQLLADAEFISEACERVRASGARIGFEITETSVIRDPETAIAHLQQVAEIGIPIAIDDYGAGLSSLAYLKQLPARELKIDKMFVMQLTSSNRDPLIVRSTIDLAHALEMEVTAEGVETQAALALLSVMGCDMLQGFLISRPIVFSELLAFLAEECSVTGLDTVRGSFNQPASFWKSA